MCVENLWYSNSDSVLISHHSVHNKLPFRAENTIMQNKPFLAQTCMVCSLAKIGQVKCVACAYVYILNFFSAISIHWPFTLLRGMWSDPSEEHKKLLENGPVPPSIQHMLNSRTHELLWVYRVHVFSLWSHCTDYFDNYLQCLYDERC